MILRARDELGLDISRSVLVGGRDYDIMAGRAAGIKHNLYLCLDRRGDLDRLVFPSLAAILDWFVGNYGYMNIAII